MSLQTFLKLNGLLFIPFGLIMLTIPSIIFPMLDVNLDSDGLIMASTVGSMLLSFGLICWFAHKSTDNSNTLRAILIGNLMFHAIDSLLTGKAAIMGDMNVVGFVFSAMHLVFAIGFGYFLLTANRKTGSH